MLSVACIQNLSLHAERLCGCLGVSALQQAGATVFIYEDGDSARLWCKFAQQLQPSKLQILRVKDTPAFQLR